MTTRRAGLFLLLMLGAAAPALAADISDHTLARPEGARHFIVAQRHVSAPGKRPLLIVLHGHGTSAAMVLGLSSFAGYKTQEWTRIAERDNLLVIAPDGMKANDGKQAWNDCRSDATTNAPSDDVGFLSALIDTAIARFNADPERVYIFGGSNGGGMAYRAGIELAHRIAAIGVQSSLMAATSSCPAPTRPLSVFVLHGTADEIAPYAGGKVGHWTLRGRGSGISAEESVAVWRKLAGLPDAPAVYRYPHLRQDDPTSATRYVWGADPEGVQVEFVKIEGGGHVGASKAEDLPWLLRKLVGAMNHDLEMAEEAWSFFQTKRSAGAR